MASSPHTVDSNATTQVDTPPTTTNTPQYAPPTETNSVTPGPEQEQDDQPLFCFRIDAARKLLGPLSTLKNQKNTHCTLQATRDALTLAVVATNWQASVEFGVALFQDYEVAMERTVTVATSTLWHALSSLGDFAAISCVTHMDALELEVMLDDSLVQLQVPCLDDTHDLVLAQAFSTSPVQVRYLATHFSAGLSEWTAVPGALTVTLSFDTNGVTLQTTGIVSACTIIWPRHVREYTCNQPIQREYNLSALATALGTKSKETCVSVNSEGLLAIQHVADDCFCDFVVVPMVVLEEDEETATMSDDAPVSQVGGGLGASTVASSLGGVTQLEMEEDDDDEATWSQTQAPSQRRRKSRKTKLHKSHPDSRQSTASLAASSRQSTVTRLPPPVHDNDDSDSSITIDPDDEEQLFGRLQQSKTVQRTTSKRSSTTATRPTMDSPEPVLDVTRKAPRRVTESRSSSPELVYGDDDDDHEESQL